MYWLKNVAAYVYHIINQLVVLIVINTYVVIHVECPTLNFVLPCILISSKLYCQQMHSLLKHKMLQLTLKISLYMAPTCFIPFGPSSGGIRRNLAKVTVFVELLVKIHR
jgi:hypothetical protein